MGSGKKMPIRFLTAVLLCSVAAFVLGWSLHDLDKESTAMAQKTQSRPNPASSIPHEVPKPSSPEPNNSGVWVRSASIPVEDHSHEVVVSHNPYLQSEDAYPVGSSEVKGNPDGTVTVRSTVKQGSPSVVEIDTGTGFGYVNVRLAFDTKTGRVEAGVESDGDTSPAPPPAWEDVSGQIWVSSAEWGKGKPVTIEYSLYGLRGGYRECTHGKVFVDL